MPGTKPRVLQYVDVPELVKVLKFDALAEPRVAAITTHYVVSSSARRSPGFVILAPCWGRLCLFPFPPSERTVELVAGFGMAYFCPCLTMIRGG